MMMATAAYSAPAINTVRPVCSAHTGYGYYFPPVKMAGEKSVDERHLPHTPEGAELAAMGEPSLSCGKSGRAYRFTWLRSFDDSVSVRVYQDGNVWVIVAVELDKSDVVVRRLHAELSDFGMKKLQRLVKSSDAWSLPTTNDRTGLDGSVWIVELRGSRRYHLIKRWSPRNGPVRAMGLAFLALTHWKFPADKIY